MTQHYDLIIIGSGAGGGTLAYALAETGKRILLIERGDYLPREKENWEPAAIFLEERYYARDRWFDEHGKGFQPETHYVVGGNTKVYGAALQRMRREDFGELKHYDGVSPAWELDYEVFEPYYLDAEELYKLHGKRDEDPTEPPARRDYPYPPFPHEPRIAEVAQGLVKAGLHPFHLTLALDRNVEDPRHSACIRCNTCDPYPCLVDAKADAQVACVDKAIQHENVTLMLNALATKLITDAAGNRIQQVEVQVDGQTQYLSSDRVVVSCGAINTSRLLLASASDRHPQGLANSSGLVGRNLMFHNHSAIIAVAQKRNPTQFQKTLGVNDFYFKGPTSNYPLGSVQLTGKAKWERLRRFAPGWLPQFVLKYIAAHSVDFWITTEDLPRPENHVRLAGDRLIVEYKENNMEPHRELIDVMKRYLRQQGFYYFWTNTMPLSVVWHQIGTCKFGSNPQESVLDLNCKAHDLENLYVVDSSFMPSMGAMNPTLTIAANALRIADHLKVQMGIQRTAVSLG